MDKKITIPAGIALMVVLAVAGMLAIFSYTAATPVQADVEADSVVYKGSILTNTTEQMTIEFTTTADIDNDTNILITFATGFQLPSANPDTAFGAITVDGSDDGSQTAVASTADGTVLTVDLAGTSISAGDVVTIVIPDGITTPDSPGSYDITVEVQDVATTGTVTVMIVDPALTPSPTDPISVSSDEIKIVLTTNEEIDASADVKVSFPDGFSLSAAADWAAGDVTITSLASDADENANPATVALTSDAPVAAGNAVTVTLGSSAILVPQGGSTELAITIGNGRVAVPSTDLFGTSTSYGITVEVGTLSTIFVHTVTGGAAVNEISLPKHLSLIHISEPTRPY